MENIHILQIVPEIFPLVWAQDPQGQGDKRPQMNHSIVPLIILAQFMYLRMAVVTGGNAVIRTGCLDLVILDSSIGQPLLFIARLQHATASAAAIIIGPVGIHVDEIFFTNHGPHNIPQVFRDRITERLSDNLARILHGKLDFQILVPVAVDLQFSFPDPFCIVFINIFDDKVMRNVEFFQSCQD
jgi:hypothetical protein